MISKELMPIAWHPNRWWDWCMSEEKRWEKRNRSNIYWRVVKVCAGSIEIGILKHFASWGIETFRARF